MNRQPFLSLDKDTVRVCFATPVSLQILSEQMRCFVASSCERDLFSLLFQNVSIGPEPSSPDNVIAKRSGEQFLMPTACSGVSGCTKPPKIEKIPVTGLAMQRSTDDRHSSTSVSCLAQRNGSKCNLHLDTDLGFLAPVVLRKHAPWEHVVQLEESRR